MSDCLIGYVRIQDKVTRKQPKRNNTPTSEVKSLQHTHLMSSKWLPSIPSNCLPLLHRKTHTYTHPIHRSGQKKVLSGRKRQAKSARLPTPPRQCRVNIRELLYSGPVEMALPPLSLLSPPSLPPLPLPPPRALLNR